VNVSPGVQYHPNAPKPAERNVEAPKRRWWRYGACVTHPEPELWLSGRPADKERAARICDQLCPVKAECRDASRGEGYGVWAGIDLTTRPS
jgi:hypothetical protein